MRSPVTASGPAPRQPCNAPVLRRCPALAPAGRSCRSRWKHPRTHRTPIRRARIPLLPAGFVKPHIGLEEALGHVHRKLDPEIKREQERLDRIATWTHQFRCPDHGDLSMAEPDAHVPCVGCHRWVDSEGRRFGYYANLPPTGPVEPFTIPMHIAFSAGGEGTDRDLGPLSTEEVLALIARSSAGE